MVSWNNMDTLSSYQELLKEKDSVKLTEVMAGENGAARVAKYVIPMAAGLAYHYAAKKVNDTILEKLAALAEEAQLSDKFKPCRSSFCSRDGMQPHVLCAGCVICRKERCKHSVLNNRVPTLCLRLMFPCTSICT